jgi:hypothetical protein
VADADPPYEDDTHERVAHVAIHRQSVPPGTLTGPRFRTLIPIPAPVPDVDPGEALRRAVRALTVGEDWRVQAWSWYDSWTKAVNDHIRRTYEAESRRLWSTAAARRWAARRQAVDGDPDSRETEQFARWVAQAVEAGTVRRQLALIDEIPVPPDWVLRYAARLRRHLAEGEGPGIADRSRPALAGAEGFRHWWHVGASIVAQSNEQPTDFADTGTFFYDPPTRPGTV